MNELRRKSRAKFRTALQAALESLEERCLLATLAGFAFMDANGDGQRGSAEYGLPGVRIELTNSEQTISRVEFTTDLGFYAFANLPAGDYSVTALHPEAVHDGIESTAFPGAQVGEDVISNIQVSESDSVSEINFGEGGIKIESI